MKLYRYEPFLNLLKKFNGKSNVKNINIKNITAKTNIRNVLKLIPISNKKLKNIPIRAFLE